MNLQAVLPKLVTFILFFVVLFIYTKLAGPIPFYIHNVTTNKTDFFTSSGEGEGKVVVKPDLASASVGVSAQGATVKVVQEEMNSKINRVAASLKDLGIKAEDIKTTNYNINPSYDFRGDSRRVTGYEASTNLSVKVREIDKINSVLDAATAAGANQVGSISFTVDDRTKAENEAREKAVEEAKRKAEASAKAAGFKLGRIINYSESFGGEPGPVYNMAIGAAEKAVDTQIETGSSEIRVIVNLSYELL